MCFYKKLQLSDSCRNTITQSIRFFQVGALSFSSLWSRLWIWQVSVTDASLLKVWSKHETGSNTMLLSAICQCFVCCLLFQGQQMTCNKGLQPGFIHSTLTIRTHLKNDLASRCYTGQVYIFLFSFNSELIILLNTLELNYSPSSFHENNNSKLRFTWKHVKLGIVKGSDWTGGALRTWM